MSLQSCLDIPIFFFFNIAIKWKSRQANAMLSLGDLPLIVHLWKLPLLLLLPWFRSVVRQQQQRGLKIKFILRVFTAVWGRKRVRQISAVLFCAVLRRRRKNKLNKIAARVTKSNCIALSPVSL